MVGELLQRSLIYWVIPIWDTLLKPLNASLELHRASVFWGKSLLRLSIVLMVGFQRAMSSLGDATRSLLPRKGTTSFANAFPPVIPLLDDLIDVKRAIEQTLDNKYKK